MIGIKLSRKIFNLYTLRPLKEEPLKILSLREIEEAYGKSPIIYLTYDSYDMYLKGEIDKYSIWIRDVFFTPDMPHGRDWSSWQYADNGRTRGIDGPVDLNVFCGKELSVHTPEPSSSANPISLKNRAIIGFLGKGEKCAGSISP